MQHVLVTGAGGYIGSILVQQLLDAGYRVSALDRFFFGDSVFEHLPNKENLNLIRLDIRDLKPKMLEGVDAVCDLAALSNDPSGDLDPSLTEAINYAGRVHVAKCAKEAGVKRYILSSSCSVYGTGGSQALEETSPTAPISVYAKASLRAEQETAKLGDSHFSWTALRNATVFGLSPRMRFDLAVNIMTLHAVTKNKIIVLGGGRQWRPLIHVGDVARGFIKVLKSSPDIVNGQVFNQGRDNYQMLGLAYTVRECMPFPVEIEIAPDDADKRNYNVSFVKMKKVLDFTPSVTIEEGVREIYQGLKRGATEPGPKTSTVGWYRAILEADRLVSNVRLNGRLI
ncbi:MAG: SDR family oxidoreductase [Bdellovibrionales bacterium]|jgi:nucleoside-diphosphate-sugar epimerase